MKLGVLLTKVLPVKKKKQKGPIPISHLSLSICHMIPVNLTNSLRINLPICSHSLYLTGALQKPSDNICKKAVSFPDASTENRVCMLNVIKVTLSSKWSDNAQQSSLFFNLVLRNLLACSYKPHSPASVLLEIKTLF